MKATFDLRSELKSRSPRIEQLLCSALLCGAMACTGQIESGTGGGAFPPGTKPPTPGKPDDMIIKPPPPPAGAPAIHPGTKGLHRLNSAEYNATVADILGTKLQPANSAWLGGELHGFDNMAAVLNVDEAQYARYFEAAGLIADDVFAAPDLKSKIVTCSTADDAGCVQGIISTTGKRLLRRPLSAEEVATFNKVYTASRTAGESHDGSIKQVLRAFLASAEFLFRMEFDPTPNAPEKHALDGYELASRLSYFLWSSAPDDALLAAAGDNSITQSDKLTAAVDRMLADPIKGARFVENFSGQWLGARGLRDHATSATVYPDWTPQVADSLTKEMYMYFADFLKSDRSWMEFMKADFNFVDGSLAKLYGMPTRTGTGLSRVEIKDDKRFGFAGLGGFLALSSLGERTSPTLRGRWVLMNLMCTEPPPPPANAGMLEGKDFDPVRNVRIALEQHRKDPACAGCHSLFDPYGLALEQFDGIGRYRTAYADGVTIDPSTVLADGTRFAGLEGMADAVTKDPKFTECFSDFMFSYSLGRQIEKTDRPYLEAVQKEWKKETPSIRRLAQSLVLAETFRYRQGAAAK